MHWLLPPTFPDSVLQLDQIRPVVSKSKDALHFRPPPLCFGALGKEKEVCVCMCVCVWWGGGGGGGGGGILGGIGRKWGLFVLCYLADISSMCRLASWQAETTGALGMLSVQEISFILINAPPNPPFCSCNVAPQPLCFLFRSLAWPLRSCVSPVLVFFCYFCTFLFCTEMEKRLITVLQL